MNDERDPFDRNPDEEDDDELTPADIFRWHVFNVMVAGFVGAFAFIAAGEQILPGVGAGLAFAGASILFAKAGGWDKVADAFTALFLVITWPIGLAARLLAPVLGPVFYALAIVVGGIGSLLARLIILAAVAFFWLGVIGLLWFGIRQLF